MLTAPRPAAPARVAALLVSLVACCLTFAPVGTPPAEADDELEGVDCSQVSSTDDESAPVSAPSAALEQLQIAETFEELELRGLSRGGGTTVAVLDSGVAPVASIPVFDRLRTVGSPRDPDQGTELFYQGTAVAGLIAGAARTVDDGGPVGVAPDATVLDVTVYDTDSVDSELETADVGSLVAALGQVAARPDVDIVNISLALPAGEGTAPLKAAIDRVTAQGKIVVVASGDRPTEETDPLFDRFGSYERGEDAAEDVVPAGYGKNKRLVVAVSSTVPDGTAYADLMLHSSAIDVAAPTAGAVSYAVNGQTCLLPTPSSRFAAAEVSGVLALLRTAYPDDSPERLVARLEETATGSAVRSKEVPPDTSQGSGVVQPLAAVTREITWRQGARIDRSRPPREGDQAAPVPEPEPDVLASTRRNAVWWGLLGGGALVVALVLRPVLARRRRR